MEDQNSNLNLKKAFINESIRFKPLQNDKTLYNVVRKKSYTTIANDNRAQSPLNKQKFQVEGEKQKNLKIKNVKLNDKKPLRLRLLKGENQIDLNLQKQSNKITNIIDNRFEEQKNIIKRSLSKMQRLVEHNNKNNKQSEPQQKGVLSVGPISIIMDRNKLQTQNSNENLNENLNKVYINQQHPKYVEFLNKIQNIGNSIIDQDKAINQSQTKQFNINKIKQIQAQISILKSVNRYLIQENYRLSNQNKSLLERIKKFIQTAQLMQSRKTNQLIQSGKINQLIQQNENCEINKIQQKMFILSKQQVNKLKKECQKQQIKNQYQYQQTQEQCDNQKNHLMSVVKIQDKSNQSNQDEQGTSINQITSGDKIRILDMKQINTIQDKSTSKFIEQQQNTIITHLPDILKNNESVVIIKMQDLQSTVHQLNKQLQGQKIKNKQLINFFHKQATRQQQQFQIKELKSPEYQILINKYAIKQQKKQTCQNYPVSTNQQNLLFKQDQIIQKQKDLFQVSNSKQYQQKFIKLRSLSENKNHRDSLAKNHDIISNFKQLDKQFSAVNIIGHRKMSLAPSMHSAHLKLNIQKKNLYKNRIQKIRIQKKNKCALSYFSTYKISALQNIREMLSLKFQAFRYKYKYFQNQMISFPKQKATIEQLKSILFQYPFFLDDNSVAFILSYCNLNNSPQVKVDVFCNKMKQFVTEFQEITQEQEFILQSIISKKLQTNKQFIIYNLRKNQIIPGEISKQKFEQAFRQYKYEQKQIHHLLCLCVAISTDINRIKYQQFFQYFLGISEHAQDHNIQRKSSHSLISINL